MDIGGLGIAGLTRAKYLVEQDYSTRIDEAELGFGTATSVHYSEVIHTVIYCMQYLHKVYMSVRGKYLLYEYCSSRRAPHKRYPKKQLLRLRW